MPFIEQNGRRTNYRWDGPESAPALVFSNSLGTQLSMWDAQIPGLSKSFHVLRYDTRGMGLSTRNDAPNTIAGLATDVVELLDALSIPRAHFCGLSMGGAIGIWLGVNAPERFDSFVLCNTAARIGTVDTWNTRIAKVREGGMAGLTEAILDRWFTQSFAQRAPESIATMRRMLLAAPPESYIACCQALRDIDQRQTVSRIRSRTLIVSGAHDAVTPPSDAHFLESQIAGARYVELDASHISNIEAAADFTAAVQHFLSAKEKN
ncbi:MAG: 3-oxoadipate enol-lactonase [Candidatus Acidiferrales bacterium]